VTKPQWGTKQGPNSKDTLGEEESRGKNKPVHQRSERGSLKKTQRGGGEERTRTGSRRGKNRKKSGVAQRCKKRTNDLGDKNGLGGGGGGWKTEKRQQIR